MGRADLIGNGKHHLIPTWQPLTDGSYTSARRKNSSTASEVVKTSSARSPAKGRLLTQHTGLPPRDAMAALLAVALSPYCVVITILKTSSRTRPLHQSTL